jgi:hypothetical protein
MIFPFLQVLEPPLLGDLPELHAAASRQRAMADTTVDR